MIFGTTYDVTGDTNVRAENATSSYMMSAWAAFGRDPVRGLHLLGWPKYHASSSSLVLLGNHNQPAPTCVDASLYDTVCPPVEQNDPLPGRGAF